MKMEAKRTIMKQPTYISRESMENNDKENNIIELRGSLNVRKHERVVDIQHSSRKQRKLVSDVGVKCKDAREVRKRNSNGGKSKQKHKYKSKHGN